VTPPALSSAAASEKGAENMTSRTTGRLAAALLVAAASASMAGSAWAQQASGASGGTATDLSSAGNTNGGGLPQIEQQGDVSYTSGGVGLDESRALLREQAHWPLSLRFTGPTSDYLSGVHVRVVGGKGGEVLSTESMGPYMLVKLPPGNYTVYAKYKDQEKKQAVTVAGPGKAKAAFHWNIQ
jgi:hypothetical protein